MTVLADEARAALARDGVFIAYALPDDYLGADASAALFALLDDQERARAARFRFERDRHTYVVAHGLVRRTLACFADVAPSDFRFTAGPHGRPEISAPDIPRPLRFNLSHTTGLVACAVSERVDVGLDVEYRVRPSDIDRLAPAVLAPAEREALERLAGEEARRRFFQYWTLKEAYIKGVGKGLALPLRQIGFDVSTGPWASVSLSGIEDDAASWAFAMMEPTPEHQLAVALRAGLQRLPQPRRFMPA